MAKPFEVPEDTMPVVMQVGDAPPRVIGWAATPADVPPLLREVADTLAEIVHARDDVEIVAYPADPALSEAHAILLRARMQAEHDNAGR